jgi:hypothetical protein
MWPSPQNYSEAVQTPQSSFSDPELQNGSAEVNPLGLPKSISGNFASVYCFDCGSRKVAVRCFLQKVEDQQERYAAVSRYVLGDDLESTVPCEYIPRGIRVQGDWYPILKMHWVSGITLNQFVDGNSKNSMALKMLAGYFKEMTLSLKNHGIAHGDLQHDNILIHNDELRLVDYDGMYVPALKNWTASELGHANYQHPKRSASDFNASLDNFSARVIHFSLKALSQDPSLWQRLNAGGDCMLLRRSDFLNPHDSPAFQQLLSHSSQGIRHGAAVLVRLLSMEIDEIPSMDVANETIVPSSAVPAAAAVSARVMLDTDPVAAQTGANGSDGQIDADWYRNYTPERPATAAKQSLPATVSAPASTAVRRVTSTGALFQLGRSIGLLGRILHSPPARLRRQLLVTLLPHTSSTTGYQPAPPLPPLVVPRGHSLALSGKLKNLIVDQLPPQEKLRYLCQLQDPKVIRAVFLNFWKKCDALFFFAVAAIVAMWAFNVTSAVILAGVIACLYFGGRTISANVRRLYVAAITDDRLLLGSARGLDGDWKSRLESIAWNTVLSVHLDKNASTLELWIRRDGDSVSMIISGSSDDLEMLQLHMPAGVKRIR